MNLKLGQVRALPAHLPRPTTFIEPARLSRQLGVELVIASEAFQHTGSFKFRAALQVAWKIPQPRIITASSGNFGQAMAYACRLLGKSCTVVMPTTSARVKIDGVLEFGGKIDLVDVRVKSRATRVAELARADPEAYVASAYDDPLVIEGNAGLGLELAGRRQNFDCVIAPVGGGGLSAGLIQGLRAGGCAAPVIGAEPLLANDAARSLAAGRIIRHATEPSTIADGARTLSLGRLNFAILRDGLAGIVEVPEADIREAVRLLFNLAHVKAEPTGALAVAALLSRPDEFRGRRVCCVVSGGNVDAETFLGLLADT